MRKRIEALERELKEVKAIALEAYKVAVNHAGHSRSTSSILDYIREKGYVETRELKEKFGLSGGALSSLLDVVRILDKEFIFIPSPSRWAPSYIVWKGLVKRDKPLHAALAYFPLRRPCRWIRRYYETQRGKTKSRKEPDWHDRDALYSKEHMAEMFMLTPEEADKAWRLFLKLFAPRLVVPRSGPKTVALRKW